MGRPGVIWLGDLGTYRWSSRKGEQMLASMGLPAGPLTPPTVALPSPLVVFAETPEQLEQARPWLGSAPFTLVRPDRDDPDEAWLWEEALQHGPPVVLRGAEGLAVALDAALEHAGPELPEPAARPRRTMLPGGPWLDWPGGTTFQTPATRIARALRTSEDAVTLHEAGEALDLRTGTRVEREGPVDPERAGRGDWRRGTATFPGAPIATPGFTARHLFLASFAGCFPLVFVKLSVAILVEFFDHFLSLRTIARRAILWLFVIGPNGTGDCAQQGDCYR